MKIRSSYGAIEQVRKLVDMLMLIQTTDSYEYVDMVAFKKEFLERANYCFYESKE